MNVNSTGPIKVLDSETQQFMVMALMSCSDMCAPSCKFSSKKEMLDYVNTINFTDSLFEDMADCIGMNRNSKRRRVALKRTSVWNVMRSFVANKRGGWVDNHHDAMAYAAEVLGFMSADEFHNAVLKYKYVYDMEGMVVVEELDKIAELCGRGDWLNMNHEENNRNLVSKSVLKRAMGKNRCESVLSMSKLDIIANFICGKSWAMYNEEQVRSQVMEKFVKKFVEKPVVSYISLDELSDLIRMYGECEIAFPNGMKRKYVYTEEVNCA